MNAYLKLHYAQVIKTYHGTDARFDTRWKAQSMRFFVGQVIQQFEQVGTCFVDWPRLATICQKVGANKFVLDYGNPLGTVQDG